MHFYPLNHKPRVQETRWINVPVQLLQQTTQSRLQRSLVSLSVALKCYSASSTYRFTSHSQFCRDFHVGKAKAKKLLDAILGGTHPLFEIHTDRHGLTLITAVSYRRQYATTITYRHHPSQAMTVVKATCRQRGDIRLTDIEQELHQLLLGKYINDKNRADELQSKGLPLTGSASHAAKTRLSLQYLSVATGRSTRTLIRQSQAAQRERLITAIRFPLWRECDDIYHTTMDVSQLIVIGSLGFSRQPNDYQIVDWRFRKRFQHIIYRHRGRMTHNVAVRVDALTGLVSQTDLHALYD